MKTLRSSRFTQERNARTAIAQRGGAHGNTRMDAGQIILTGRRLRRAARSNRAVIYTHLVNGRGGFDVAPAGMAETILTRVRASGGQRAG